MSKVLLSNEFWGRRSGMFDVHVPKGHKEPVGPAFRQASMGKASNNSKKKARSIWFLVNEANKRRS